MLTSVELEELMKKRARELAVPTNDNAVKLKLREYNEPITMFAEAAPERRERLRGGLRFVGHVAEARREQQARHTAGTDRCIAPDEESSGPI